MHPNIPHHFERRPGDYPTKHTPAYGWRDDNGHAIHDIDDQGNPICGRISSMTGEPCRRNGQFLSPNGRCVTPGHGGRAKGAPPLHGRYSKFLPTRLAAQYEEITGDDVICNVRENIALIAAMIQERLTELGEQTSAELWAKAVRIFEAAKGAIIENDETTLYIALDELGSVLKNGQGAQQKNQEILDLMMRSGNLTKVEITRIEKTGQFMTAREMLANGAQVIAILKKHVEPSVLAKVSAELGIATYARHS
jgi:hypothetical protein